MMRVRGIFRRTVPLLLWVSGVCTAGEWQIQMIDTGGPGKYSSLKIDKEGNAHVAYVIDEGSHYPLKYGFWDHVLRRWFVMTVEQNASFCSLTLDSQQHPHISYADAGGGSGAKLRYASWDGRAWKREAIPLTSDVVGYYTSIALDANDRPSISFYEYRGPKGTDIAVRMRVVAWDGKHWLVNTIDDQNQSGKFNALAIDSKGHKHLVYANVNALTTGMRYAYWDGKAWLLEIFDGPEQNALGYVGYAAALALDRDGDPHASYMNYSTPAVKYAVRKNGRWKVELVERLAGVAYPDRNGITVDDHGDPYMSYYDSGRGTLRLAHLAESKWMVETVDSGACGYTSSVQVDRGSIWISYADEASGGLKVARREVEQTIIVKPSPSGRGEEKK
jgi:hypothetical protein